jgi:hypothetical protein
MPKNEAAVALGRLRAAKGDLAAVGSLGGLAARGKPRKRQPVEKCACGKMSKARAFKRNHVCDEAGTIPKRIRDRAKISAKEQS